MSEAKFVDGLFVKRPHENAPGFVKCKISMKVQDVLEWLSGQSEEWVNLDIKESKEGKLYAQVDDWKPEEKKSYNQTDEPVPF